MTDFAININKLTKSFGTTKVLNGVDLKVMPGEIFALLGSNGAGKTTTIKILSTLIKADGGNAVVCGYDVNLFPGKVRENISLTGQFAAVDDVLTGRENLKMIARLRRIAESDTVIKNLLDRFGLVDAADRKVSAYSGGMIRKLDIAMSLIGTPPVLFLDEPTTGLDPEARQEVWKTVKGLSDGGTTIFLTTQYLEEAEHLSDKIAILHKGKIIAEGTLEELKKLLPPAKTEYIKRQPTLEEIYLAIVGRKEEV